MIDQTPSPSTTHTPPVKPSLPRQSTAGQHSPGMLFGGDAIGSSIWTMTREESGRGTQRGNVTPNVNIANIWGNPEQTPSPPALMRQSSSQQGWHRASASGTWGKDGGVGGHGVQAGGLGGSIGGQGGGPSPIGAGRNGQRQSVVGQGQSRYPP